MALIVVIPGLQTSEVSSQAQRPANQQALAGILPMDT